MYDYLHRQIPNGEMENQYDLNDVSYNYCPNCSQKIDWSDWV